MADFSWKRAFKHAAIPCVLAIGGLAALSTRVKDPEKLGEDSAKPLLVLLGVCLGVSYLFQQGRRKQALAVALAFVALIGGLVAWGFANRSRPLTAADRAPLVDVTEDGMRWLRHPTLGFAIHHPGAGFVEEPSAVAMIPSRDDHSVYYAYANAEHDTILVVNVLHDLGASRESFEQAFHGIETGIRESVLAKFGSAVTVNIVDRQTMWFGDRGEMSLHAVIGQGHFRVHAFAMHPSDKPPYVVELSVISATPDALASVLAQIRG
jgi:hypothetical protein